MLVGRLGPERTAVRSSPGRSPSRRAWRVFAPVRGRSIPGSGCCRSSPSGLESGLGLPEAPLPRAGRQHHGAAWRPRTRSRAGASRRLAEAARPRRPPRRLKQAERWARGWELEEALRACEGRPGRWAGWRAGEPPTMREGCSHTPSLPPALIPCPSTEGGK